MFDHIVCECVHCVHMLAAIAFLVYQYYDVSHASLSSNKLNITESINSEVMWNYEIMCVRVCESAFERKPHNWRSSTKADSAVLGFGFEDFKVFWHVFYKIIGSPFELCAVFT